MAALPAIGRYRIIQPLGNGGMGTVYLAAADGLGGMSKLCVLKVLSPQHTNDARLVQLFLAEARLAVRPNHQNVVQAFDAGRDGGLYYLVMEHLPGVSLHRVLNRSARRSPPLTSGQRLELICQALQGLHHLHELRDYDGTPLGVIHRDLSPENLVVTYDGVLKVVDLGLATTLDGHVGEVVGKATYMAPEQARAEQVDRRADVFSVGVILWEMAAGARLWGTAEAAEILLHLRVKDPIPAPSAVNPAVPPELERVVMRAVAQRPCDRYPNAEVFADDLRELVGPVASLSRWMAEAFSAERTQLDESVRYWFVGATSEPAPTRSVGDPSPATPHVGHEEVGGSLTDTVQGLCQLDGVLGAAVIHRDGQLRAVATRSSLEPGRFVAALKKVLATDDLNRATCTVAPLRSQSWVQLERGWMLVRRVPNGVVGVVAADGTSDALVRVGVSAAILKMAETVPIAAAATVVPAVTAPQVLDRLAMLVAPHVGPLAAVLVRRTISNLGGPAVLKSGEGQRRLAGALISHVPDVGRRPALEREIVFAIRDTARSTS